MFLKRFVWTFAILSPVMGVVSHAEDGIRTEQLRFAKGQSSTTVSGTIKGDQTVDYRIDVRNDQTMTISLQSKKAFFNINEPGAGDVSIFVGSSAGNRFEGPVKQTGTYTIRVYQMRNTARRGATAPYTLRVDVR